MTGPRRILFAGLGQMGAPMAARLVSEGHNVIGLDRDGAAAEAFAAQTGGLTDTGDSFELVITVLPDDRIVRDVLFGPKGIAKRLLPGGLVIDMSSSAPHATQATAAELSSRGLRLVDAPVSGGVARARAGDLAIMAGGAESDVAEARAVLAPLARGIVHAGPVGAGHAAKALNNFVSASGLVATCQALLVAERFGIAPDTMTEVLNGSSGRTNTSEAKLRPFILSGTYGSGFSMSLMVKDLGIAADLAGRMGVARDVLGNMHALWREADAALGAGADHTEMHRHLQQCAAGGNGQT